MLELATSGSGEQPLHGLGVILELGHGGCLIQCELVGVVCDDAVSDGDRCGYVLLRQGGALGDLAFGESFQRQLVDEAVAVAQAQGVAMRVGLADEVMGKLAAMPASFRSSMAEDLERGNRLELSWLSGRVHGLGVQLGVGTPAHTAVYRGLVLHEQGAAPAAQA